MRLYFLLLVLAVFMTSLAAEDLVELDAFRASVSKIYFQLDYVAGTDRIAEIRVIWVAPGSGAEKAGLCKGDRLIAINGVPVTLKKRSDVVNQSCAVAVRGTEVTFTGRHGFLQRNWSLIARIDSQGKLEPEVEVESKLSKLPLSCLLRALPHGGHRDASSLGPARHPIQPRPRVLLVHRAGQRFLKGRLPKQGRPFAFGGATAAGPGPEQPADRAGSGASAGTDPG
jgi:hypothetical protein